MRSLRDEIQQCDGLIDDYLSTGDTEEVEHLQKTRQCCIQKLEQLKAQGGLL
ncbi:hypothetical protein [Chitinolyticbacter meiyuanensis]|uniref:hypothetical protein n=1 Tax=Chitinolyticbacter meiyuanensis TaxID=682798 RepID=UPI0016520023|nr:hypothetical protein [Chitinolyticbacter meiyuanensis]